ncbi:MAG: ABC transporter substrate-binding protein [Thermodesulfobacteriota bacterium]|nr:ABC transporter substrate-binding protein [Thermodesulfobacteriota bacterium]
MLCYCSAGACHEVLAVQSISVKPYDEAIEGFKSACDVKINRLFTKGLEGADVARKINRIKPEIVLAVGSDALQQVKRIKNIPVVYLMVLNPQSILSGEKNITGVSMNIPQKTQLVALFNTRPFIKNIGLLYDPERTGHIVDEAKDAAGEIGIKLITQEVHNSKEVTSLIMNMKGKIDAFWMVPDITVITPETVEFLLLFSLNNGIPILSFSKKYVEMGALMSIGIDAFDIGMQAGEMCKNILSGGDVMNVHMVDPRNAVISVNLKTAKNLGINIDKETIKNAIIVNRKKINEFKSPKIN